MNDRSLSEFADDGDEQDASDAGGDDGDADSVDDTPGELLATAQFSPDGTPCEKCGAVVVRRWHDDGQFVCADCKNW
ncbi:DUF7573 domain-containing protein [Halosegnis longus]|uniref:DUF7573 domain-containing protein n=1 Tax=Halosegnis longus TaxID=2216012 RepID=UPI00096A4ADF|nr:MULTISPECIES: hypothetical protein [Halobacteriales]